MTATPEDEPAATEPRRLYKAVLRTERIQRRLLRREGILMALVMLMIATGGYLIAAGRHSDANTIENRRQIETLKSQNADLVTQNGILKGQVTKLKTALAQNETDTLRNRQTGLDSRGVSCDVLKALSPSAWRQNTACQNLDAIKATPAPTP